VAADPSGLSAREIDVLRLVAEGLSNAEVAARLAISTGTVNVHLSTLYGKLGVQSRTAAVRAAREQQVL
jgi:DNA-binding CsgD family transcriptional regulator